MFGLVRAIVIGMTLATGGLSAGYWLQGPKWEHVWDKLARAQDWLGEAVLGWMIALTAGFLAREKVRWGEGWASATWAYMWRATFVLAGAVLVVALGWPREAGWEIAVAAWAAAGIGLAGYVANLPPRI
jgi:hypothetical protein